jgi:Holliday junction DNA helicase RuvB
MELSQKEQQALHGIIEFEESHDRKDFSLGWAWSDVRVAPSTLNNLLLKGLIEEEFHSNSYRGMLLTKLGHEQAKILLEPVEVCPHPQGHDFMLTESVFEDIIGHEDIKELLQAALTVEKPVHVLLTGPPALAKSLFLWDIERAAGEQAIWLLGSATSKAGLWDLVAERQPQILLIDELDKMNATDTGALLSLMEGGRLVRTKKDRSLDVTIHLRVVAATNVISKLSVELKSRFAIKKLEAYDAAQYRTVVKGVLMQHENASLELAEEVARKLEGRTQDVRDAVRVARLSLHLGVDRAIHLLLT